MYYTGLTTSVTIKQDILIDFFNVVKFQGEHIGADPLLPYLDPNLTGKKLLNGANFASAGVGILNDTGMHFVSCNCIILKCSYQTIGGFDIP